MALIHCPPGNGGEHSSCSAAASGHFLHVHHGAGQRKIKSPLVAHGGVAGAHVIRSRLPLPGFGPVVLVLVAFLLGEPACAAVRLREQQNMNKS